MKKTLRKPIRKEKKTYSCYLNESVNKNTAIAVVIPSAAAVGASVLAATIS